MKLLVGLLIVQVAPESTLVWPPPPEPARLEMVGVVSQVKDLKESWVTRLVRRLTRRGSPYLFLQPYGLDVDEAGRVYVTDHGLRRVVVLDLLHKTRRYIPFRGEGYRFQWPQDVAVWDRGGKVFVVDPEQKKVFVFDQKRLAFEEVLPIQEFKRPVSLAVDEERGILYVADAHAHCIWLWDLAGRRLLGKWGERGTDPGMFNFPTFVTVGPRGWVYVTDMGNFRVQVFSPDGEVMSFFGEPGDKPPAMARPRGLAVSRDEKIFLTDALFAGFTVYDVFGRAYLFVGGVGRGFGQFSMPGDIAIDGQNHLYVTDPFNHRLQIFRYLPQEEE